MPAYKPDTCALLYSLWLSATADNKSFPPHPSYSSIEHRFKVYTVHLAFGWAWRPTRGIEHHIDYVTSSEDRMTPEERAVGHHVGISEGGYSFEVPAVVMRDFSELLKQKQLMAGPAYTPKTFSIPAMAPTWAKPIG